MLPSVVNQEVQKILNKNFQKFKYPSTRVVKDQKLTKEAGTSTVELKDSALSTTKTEESESLNTQEPESISIKSSQSEDSQRENTKLINEKTKELAGLIKDHILGYNIPDYKYVVQVNLFQNRDSGARVDCQTLWDSDKDQIIQETYNGDQFTCVAIIFAISYY